MLFPITFLAALATITPLFTPVFGHPVPFTQDQNSLDTLVTREPHAEDGSLLSTFERRDGGALSSVEDGLFERDLDMDVFERDLDMDAIAETFERRSLHDYEQDVGRRSFWGSIKKGFNRVAKKVSHVVHKVGRIAGKVVKSAQKIAAVAGKVAGVASKFAPLILIRDDHDLTPRDLSLSPNPSLPSLASRNVELAQEVVFERDMNLQPEGWLEERSMDPEFELEERDFDFDFEEDFE